GLLLAFHWGITVLLFVSAVPGVLVRLRHARELHHWERKRTPTDRQAWYFNRLLTQDSHAKEIRLFDLGPLFARWFNELRQQLRRERLAMNARRAVHELLAGAMQ